MKKTMKINHRIEIDLLEFTRSGKFDVLKNGQTREWVLNNFPDPDDFENGESWRKGEFEIFNYGDFELHFSHDILFLIFADFAGKIDEGKSLTFSNKWIFEEDTAKLNLPYVINELLKEKIDFSTKRNDDLNSITLKTTGDVKIHFEADESTKPMDYCFTAICIYDRSVLNKE